MKNHIYLTDNKRQRRQKLMADIGKEAQFRLVQLLVTLFLFTLLFKRQRQFTPGI